MNNDVNDDVNDFIIAMVCDDIDIGHNYGVGKSCTAIAVAEKYDIMKEIYQKHFWHVMT